jgi:hypothetical protein
VEDLLGFLGWLSDARRSKNARLDPVLRAYLDPKLYPERLPGDPERKEITISPLREPLDFEHAVTAEWCTCR